MREDFELLYESNQPVVQAKSQGPWSVIEACIFQGFGVAMLAHATSVLQSVPRFVAGMAGRESAGLRSPSIVGGHTDLYGV